jgi:hypothetical protein
MAKNPVTPLFSKIRKMLFEETEDPMAPDGCRTKRRRIIHNAYIIQALAVIAGIGSLSVVPLVVIMITIPYFVLAYIVWAFCTGIIWLIIRQYVIRLNNRSIET